MYSKILLMYWLCDVTKPAKQAQKLVWISTTHSKGVVELRALYSLVRYVHV